MKINKTILSIAIIYNLINFLFWEHIKIMNNATSMIYLLIFPIFWIISIIILIILALKNKSNWFNVNYKITTIISLFFVLQFCFQDLGTLIVQILIAIQQDIFPKMDIQSNMKIGFIMIMVVEKLSNIGKRLKRTATIVIQLILKKIVHGFTLTKKKILLKLKSTKMEN